MAKQRVKTIDIKKFKNALLTAAKAYTNEEFIPDVVIPEVQEFAQALFEKTTQGWEGGSGASGMKGSSKTHVEPKPPTLHFDVEQTRVGATITAYVESYIWNLLDQGREDRVTKKKEAFIPRSDKGTHNGQRTLPGTLDVSSDRQYKKLVVVPAGTTIEGFKARGWSDIIAEEVEKEFSRKYPHIKFSFTMKEQNLGN